MTAGYQATAALAGRRDQLFPALSKELIARVATNAREQTFDAGELVWEQGDPEVQFHVVLEGQLEIVHPEGAIERPVTIHEAGEFTGEIALLVGRRTLVRARAKTKLRLRSRS